MIVVTGANGGIARKVLEDSVGEGFACKGLTTSRERSRENPAVNYITVAAGPDDSSIYDEYFEIFCSLSADVTGLALLHGVAKNLNPKSTFFEVFRENLEVNLVKTVLIIEAFLDARTRLKKSPVCSVVLAGTASANRGGRIDRNPGYATAKYALQNLAMAYGKLFPSTFCRFNCVALGFIDSGMHFNSDKKFSSTSRAASIPLGRAGSVSDASSIIRFLLSSDSEFINGETIRCDGGDFI